MNVNWNVIFAHQWPDKLYAYGVEYLRTGVLPSDVVGPGFVKRFESGYTLNEQQEIVLITKQAPWNVNRNNKVVLFETTKNSYVFKVIPESGRDKILDTFIVDPKSVSLNAHTLFDKIFRQGYLGISRRYIHTYLTKNPRALNIRMNKADLSKQTVKSFRPEYPFQHWQMDLIDYNKLFRDNKGFRYILVIIDIFTKFVYLYPLKHKGVDGGNNDVPYILNKLFLSGDVPDILHSDQGTEFRNRAVHEVCVEFNVRQIFGKPYSPQTQGFVENKNKQIKSLINSYFIQYGKPVWYSILDRIAYTINNSKHFVTGYTPMQLHRGRDVNKQYTLRSDNSEYANIEFEFDSELQRNYKIKNEELYNRRVNHVSNVLKSEATKRELAERNQPEIRVGTVVRIATYTKSPSDKKIVGVLIKIGERVVTNPLKYTTDKVSRQLADLKARSWTMFSKTILNTRKFYPQIFRVHGVHRVDNTIRYTLVQYDTDERVYLKVANDVQTLTDIHPLERVWDERFKRSHLMVLNPLEFNKYANIPTAPRPNHLSMIHVDYLNPNNNNNGIGPNNKNNGTGPNNNNGIGPNNNNNNNGSGHTNLDNLTYENSPIEVVMVAGDGNCMFRAAVKGVDLIGRRIVHDTHKRLREEVVRRNYEECVRNPSHFLSVLNMSNNGRKGYQDCDAYRNYMSKAGTWGGNTELLQIRNILREHDIGLQVFEVNRDNNVFKIPDFDAEWEGNMLVRLLRVNQNHYNVIAPSTVPLTRCDVELIVGPKYRRKIVNTKIGYVWIQDNAPREYQGRINKYVGAKVQKDGPFAGRRSGSFFEITGVVENDGTVTKHDLELRPELYGKMNTADGWRFVDEKAVFEKCERFFSKKK